MAYGRVYKVTNLVNGKVYIGQTIRSLEHRWNQHKQAAGYQRYGCISLRRAMAKYGVDNFSVEEIAVAEDQKTLDQSEIYWIDFYKSHKPKHGYNRTFGGQGVQATPEVRKKQVRAMSKALSGERNPFYGRTHSVESRALISKSKRANPYRHSKEECLARSRRSAGSNNPMYGRKLTPEQVAKKKKRWQEFREQGRKMNLSEEARELRREQAARMREKKAAMRKSKMENQ